MAYTIISQNNSTTTLSDGVNTITVPSRVNLTSGNFTIVEVNNNMATLEDGDGNVYRDIPCVATLASDGGGGSGLPDQTGHSGEFLTTDGTDASWAAVDALPSQTGHSGEFLTTDGTDASWSDKIKLGGSGASKIYGDSNGIAIGNYYTSANNIQGTAVGGDSSASAQDGTAIGWRSQATASAASALGPYTTASGRYSIAIGPVASATAERAYQIGVGTNSTAHSLSVGTYLNDTINNYQLLDLTDGTIPTARFTTDPVADGTYVPTLTIASGVATRSWSAPSGGLPSQTGNSGKFLTTDGTDASWSDKPIVNNATGYQSLVLNTNPNATSTNLGGDNNVMVGFAARVSHSNSNYNTLVGCGAITGDSNYSRNIAIGWSVTASAQKAIVIGTNAAVTADYAIQLGNRNYDVAINSDANTFKVANNNGNYEMMSADGTIPTARLTKVNSTITLAAADWSSNTQTVTVTGMTATGVVLVSPDPTDQAAYTSAGILCTAQAADSLTFTCSTTPTGDLDVVVVML